MRVIAHFQNNCEVRQILASPTVFNCSLVANTINDWNQLPNNVVIDMNTVNFY